MTLLIPEFQHATNYPKLRVREAYEHAGGAKTGACGIDDFKVAWQGGGVATVSAGGFLFPSSKVGTGNNGLYHIENGTGTTVTITAAHATLPRLDKVTLRMSDTSHGGASDTATLQVLTGTPTSGATFLNQSGAPTVPATDVLLADSLMPAAGPTATIYDRRPMAYGDTGRAAVAASVDYTYTNAATTGSPSFPGVEFRLEASGGKPVIVNMWARGQVLTGTFPAVIATRMYYRTSAGVNTALPGSDYQLAVGSTTDIAFFVYELMWTPPADGTYYIYPGFWVTSGATSVRIMNVDGSAAGRITIGVHELRQPLSTRRGTA